MRKWLNFLLLCVTWVSAPSIHGQPIIIEEPRDQTNVVGSKAVFSVLASGTPPLRYQWRAYQNLVVFTNIPNATNATLCIEDVSPSFLRYRVEVTNVTGTALSRLAQLTVVEPPVVTEQPTDVVVDLAANAVIAVEVEGSEPLSFQWYRNGIILENETSISLDLQNVSVGDAGNYIVEVSNPYGSQTSKPITLTIFEPIREVPITTDDFETLGVAWGDYNNDDYIDMFVSNGWPNSEVNALYQNLGNGQFRRMTLEEVGLIAVDQNVGASCAWGDYNNDGHLDMMVATATLNGGGNLLYENNGDGTFNRVLLAGGLTDDRNFTFSVSWGDFDNDGLLDVFAADGRNGRYVFNGYRSASTLYRNDGDGTFSNVSGTEIDDVILDAESARWSDIDDDGDLDIILSTGPSNVHVFENLDGVAFQILRKHGFPGYSGFSSTWADYDNDGLLDGFLSAGNTINSLLLHNESEGGFSVAALSTRSTVSAWGDYNNDGFLDLFVGTAGEFAENSLYHNNGDGTFRKIETTALVTTPGSNEGGCAWGDYDNNGFLDLMVGNSRGFPNFLYRNHGNSNHWLIVKLVGTASNRSGIGAKVKLKANIRGQNMWQLREIGGGGWGQNDLRAHFGLADATTVDTLLIEWPSGTTQELTNLAADRIIRVFEPPLLVSKSPGSIQLRGGEGLVYEIQGSTNFINWESLVTLTNQNGSLIYTDPEAASLPWRFYRAIQHNP